MKKFKWKGIGLLTFFTIIMCVIAGCLAIDVKADPVIIPVEPGANTLKEAVARANNGDILELKAGSYSGNVSDKTVVIDKSITIKGVGNYYSKTQTVIDVPLKVKADEEVTVNLKNFTSSSQTVEPNFIFIQVDSKANLNIDDVSIWGILRGSSSGYARHDAVALDVTENADGSEITSKNSWLSKPGVHYGISVKASDTIITLDKTEVSGRCAVRYENGSGNALNINNGSNIIGPSVSFTDKEAILINNQQNLTINVNNATIKGSIPSDKGPIKIFSFGSGKNKSTGVKINVKNGSEIKDQDLQNSKSNSDVVFGYGNDYTAADNNVVEIDNTSSVYLSEVDGAHSEVAKNDLEVSRLYSVVDDAAVIGVFDKDGNEKIKLYDNDTSISELTDDNYTKLEGSKFKGWFNNKEYTLEYTKRGESYPNAVAGENMNLYPKFAKILNITIKDVPVDGGSNQDKHYTIEEGQTISESEQVKEIRQDLEKISNKEGLQFKGFVIYNSNASTTYENIDKLINELKMTEDCRIEAINKVQVTINGEEFSIDAGQSLNDIKKDLSQSEKYDTAKMIGSDDREFSRFVKKNSDTTVTEEEGITSSVELTSKFLQKVTINGNTYSIEEGKVLNSDNNIKEALKSISGEVSGRKFDRFVDAGSKSDEINPNSTPINKNLTIESIYTIVVTLRGKTDTKTYTIDVDSNLRSLKNDSDVKAALDDVALNIADGHDFDGFVVSCDIDNTNETFDTDDYNSNMDQLKEALLDHTLSYNTTIYAEYVATVTINSEKFELKTGNSLKTGILDSKDNTLIERYKKAKLKDKDENRFYKYVDDDGNEISEDDEITKSMTLTPKYFVFVTIEDEREGVKGTYNLEEGKSINDLIGDDAQTALAALRTDIVPEEDASLDAENLHFEKLVKSDGDEIPSKINEDISIKGLYHYDVVIVEDYDNPNDYTSNPGDVDAGKYGFKVYRGDSLSKGNEIKVALDRLKTSATKSDDTRRFYSYLETNTGREFTYNPDEQTYESSGSDGNKSLLDTVFNRHLYITARVQYKVEVGEEVSDYVIEQHPLSEYKNLDTALQILKKDNKQIRNYTINGSEVEESILKDTIITDYTKINATYDVNVSIGSKTYSVKEGGKLSDLDSVTQSEIKEELKKLQEKEGFNFNGYNVGNDIDEVMDYTFLENTTVTPKFNIKITIDGQGFPCETGDTLKDIDTLDEIKNKNEPDQVFLKFVDEDGNEVSEDYHFENNMTLTTKYAYKITIDGDSSYRLEVGEALDSDSKIKAKLDELFNKDGKVFNRFEDSDGNIVDRTVKGAITKHTTIKAVYSVEIDINGHKFVIDEGAKLNTYKPLSELTDYLDTLESVSDKKFDKYIVDENELERSELLEKEFTKNTTVLVNYNVEITIDGDKVIVPIGSKISNEKLQNKIDSLSIPSNKSSIAYFVDESGNIIGDDYTFNKSMTITPKYNVRITIGDDNEEVVEGSKISSATELMKKLDNKKEKDFKGIFKDGKTPEDVVDENITLEPLYTIKVTVDGVSYTLDEGKTLNDLEIAGYTKPNRFKEFRDSKGDKLDESTELHEYTNVTAIYMIVVTLPDNSTHELESGKTLVDLGNDILDPLKKSSDGRNFSRFVDGDGVTVEEDAPLTKDIKITPKFNIKISIFRKDDEGNPIEDDKIELELGEDLPISSLTKGEAKKLQDWIDEVVKKLAEEGKVNYAFSKFVDEDGNDIDLNKSIFNADSTIEAVFSEKRSDTPDLGNIGKGNDNSNKNHPTKVPVPDTGGENSSLFNKIVEGLLSILLVLLVSGPVFVYKTVNVKEK